MSPPVSRQNSTAGGSGNGTIKRTLQAPNGTDVIHCDAGESTLPVAMTLTTDHLWPHARDQSSKLFALLDRMRDVKHLIEDTADFFKAIESVEATAAKEYRKALKCFRHLPSPDNGPPTFDESTTGPGVTGAIASVYAIGEQHATIAKHIHDNALKSIDFILACHHKRVKDIKATIEKESTAISKSRAETLSAISTHVKTHTLASSRRSTSGDLMDPWLTEMALQIQLFDNVTRENAYQAAMLTVIGAAKDTESQALTDLRQVLTDHLDTRTTQADSLRDTLSALHATVARFDTQRAFVMYAQSMHLAGSPVWHEPRSVQAFPYRIEEAEGAQAIVMQGVLSRLGTIRKSKWKPSWFVLTELGFLHCFEEKHPPFAPMDARAGGGQEAKSTASFGAAPKMPKILFSVCLRDGRALANYLPNEPEHSFEIVTQPPTKDSGLFTIGKKKEAKYMIKADTEESMVDWVCAIRRIIGQHAPMVPASPVHYSHTSLDRVALDKPLPMSPTLERTPQASQAGAGEPMVPKLPPPPPPVLSRSSSSSAGTPAPGMGISSPPRLPMSPAAALASSKDRLDSPPDQRSPDGDASGGGDVREEVESIEEIKARAKAQAQALDRERERERDRASQDSSGSMDGPPPNPRKGSLPAPHVPAKSPARRATGGSSSISTSMDRLLEAGPAPVRPPPQLPFTARRDGRQEDEHDEGAGRTLVRRESDDVTLHESK
ncbi:hypothetical protein BCR44DRAFT_1513482 [Catenaria anguillulae PL171]|uniref:PH domain-containing protein n=1 Tax=Catenaria anguillulae PL171 TaxID=765915 RepID=A0A1Y2HPH8_9FUNG|nr:hypothetical protein BCR44DRAFT_1513482 [Catenaria anguillulae PL171]